MSHINLGAREVIVPFKIKRWVEVEVQLARYIGISIWGRNFEWSNLIFSFFFFLREERERGGSHN